MPAVIGALNRLEPCPAFEVAQGILESTDRRPDADWRSATWGDRRAAGALQASLPELEPAGAVVLSCAG